MKRSLYVFTLALATALAFTTPAHAADGATVTLYGGASVANSISDSKSVSRGIEQSVPTTFGSLDLGYLNEGHIDNYKRDGIYIMPEFVYHLTPKLSTSFALGPYFTSTTIINPNGVTYQDHYSVAALSALNARYFVTDSVSVTARWGHVFYARDNRDTDVFMVGVGYTFDQ